MNFLPFNCADLISAILFCESKEIQGETKRGGMDLFKPTPLPFLVPSPPPPQGVYATREFAPFDVIGEYVGRVVPPKVCGEYVATIDWEDCRLSDGAGHLWGVDSALYGSE